MKRTMRIGLIGLILLLIVVGAMLAHSYQREEFNGSRVQNAGAYLMDIEWMNGTDLHTLELKKGDILHIRFEAEEGSLYMEIKAPDGTTIYQGNGKETTDFTINIPESGAYAIVVEARRAKGTIHIQLTEGKQFTYIFDTFLRNKVRLCYLKRGFRHGA